MAGKGRGKRLTDCERMEIIAKLEDPECALSRAACAKDYGVSPAAISKLMKGSQAVKKRYSDAGESGQRDKRQRGGLSRSVRFEDELFQWISSVRARKVPLLVSHVQQKAKLLAAQHGAKEDFKASNGWYYRFCGRYGLQPAVLHAGHSAGSSQEPLQETKTEDEATTQQLKALRDRVETFGDEFVYTLSEARLFYQLLPSQIRPDGQDGEIAARNAVDRYGLSTGGGKTPRVLVLLCANATGTHKIPLLVVGKEEAPSCLTALQPPDSEVSSALTGVDAGRGLGASYYSQREVWCDDRTFQHWCRKVFVPAVRRRTSRPVLLIAENPGGRIMPFYEEHVSTAFLPPRASIGANDVALLTQPADQNGQLSGVETSSNGMSSSVYHQPLHGAIIRDLKRRYKISLFQERINFLDTPDDDKLRLMQRALKKPDGSAGIALGRAPHALDAMRLLAEAWEAIPSALISSSWVKSSLGSIVELPMPTISEPDDDFIVIELCSLLQKIAQVDDVNGLAKELRQWLYVDDDSSERMQQELLHDIQQLLQEEQQIISKECVDQELQDIDEKSGTQQQGSPQTQLRQQQENASTLLDTASLPTNIDPSQAGILSYRNADQQPASESTMDSNGVLLEKQKMIANALRAIAEAEEALDNADVAGYFGESATTQALEDISRTLRRLHRIQRGKQSTLVAVAVNAAPNGEGASGALATHEYFYGSVNASRNNIN